MRFPIPIRDIPGRLAAGAYIAHTGWEKWRAADERAAGIHGMASGAFPFLKAVPPEKFIRLLSAGEMALGATLLTPWVRSRAAGAALAAFSGSLLAMYWRTPALHRPGSIWPTQAGTAVSKDVWLLGLGLGLVASDVADREESV
jgi:hypothetical protein